MISSSRRNFLSGTAALAATALAPLRSARAQCDGSKPARGARVNSSLGYLFGRPQPAADLDAALGAGFGKLVVSA